MTDNTTAHVSLSRTTRLGVLALVITLVGASVVGAVGVASGQQTAPADTGNATGTAEPVADDTYSIDELKRGGKKIPDARPGIRVIPGKGSVALLYEPTKPLSSGPKLVSADTTLNTDDLTVYSSLFGVDAQELTLHIVYWRSGTETVDTDDGTVTRTVPTDVRKQTARLDVGEGYDRNEITLIERPKPGRVTMWVTQNGHQVDGLRWAFKYRLIASATASGIGSTGELWGYLLKFAFLPGIVGIGVATGAGNRLLDRAGRGPNLGAGTYALWGAGAAFVIATIVWVETSALLNRVPILWGALITAVAFLAYVENAGPSTMRVLIEQHVLDDAVSPRGDDVKDELYERVESIQAVRREDGDVGLPKDGIRPFLARIWADPAVLSDLDVPTRVQIEGDFAMKFYVDPDSENVLIHQPAHLRWVGLFTDRDDTSADTGSGDDDTGSLLDRVNLRLVAGGGVGGVVGYGLATLTALSPLTWVGVAVGAVIGGTTAVDGRASIAPAPLHGRAAKASVVNLAQEYSDAKTIEQAEQLRFEAEATTAAEIRERERDRDKTLSLRLAESASGVSFNSAADEPNHGAPVEQPDSRQNGHVSDDFDTDADTNDTGGDTDNDNWRGG